MAPPESSSPTSSVDGEEGYPGTLKVTVTYTLNDDNELKWVQVTATTDKATPVNIVQHAYWNLSAAIPTPDINLIMFSRHSRPSTSSPPTQTASFPPMETSARSSKTPPLTSTSPTAIGERINDDFEASIPLVFGKGYDHCWVLREGKGVRLAATLHDPKSGRTMEILTDQPGIQFYRRQLPRRQDRRQRRPQIPRRSPAASRQRFPDSPNQPSFPSAILQPGETYTHTMIHKFSAK